MIYKWKAQSTVNKTMRVTAFKILETETWLLKKDV